MAVARYSIAEWYGQDFLALAPSDRMELASQARRHRDGHGDPPPCPFQNDHACTKAGGVCGIRRYARDNGRIGEPLDEMVVTCPKRFEEDNMVLRWLSEIIGLDNENTYVAREVPFMIGTQTNKAAGKIDFVIATDNHKQLTWHALEIQAVYFSGENMEHDFLMLANDEQKKPPFPQKIRRPDWRSSSAKRLMPQLLLKGPVLRRWNAKLAVCVDPCFFDAIGGPSCDPRRDIDSGEVIWLAPEFVTNDAGARHLCRGHWEVLTLEESQDKLQAAKTLTRSAFEKTIREKMQPIERETRDDHL